MSSTPVKALWFGRLPYLKGIQIQEALFNRLNANKASNKFDTHYLCLFEHTPVYTVGLRDKLYSKDEEQRLRNLGADFVRIRRGGMITFHGPGQLVGYPVYDLRYLHLRRESQRKHLSLGVKSFVDAIEEVIIRVAGKDFGIPNVSRTKDTGVWVEEDRKIAAIGIQVRHGITGHGFALNCHTDLTWFDKIVPCGIDGKTVTSLSKELDRKVEIPDTFVPLCRQIESVFDVTVSLDTGDPLTFC